MQYICTCLLRNLLKILIELIKQSFGWHIDRTATLKCFKKGNIKESSRRIPPERVFLRPKVNLCLDWMILNRFKLQTISFSLKLPTVSDAFPICSTHIVSVLSEIHIGLKACCLLDCWGCWPNLQSALNYFCLLLLLLVKWKDEKHVAYKCKCVCVCYSFVCRFINKQIKMQQADRISWEYTHAYV